MERRRNPIWLIVGATVGYLLLPVVIVGAVLIGARADDDGAAPATRVGSTTTLTGGEPADVAEDRLASLESTGRALTMVEQHQAMMDQMRVNATPAMLQLMNNDPMWQMMRSGEYVRLLEEHEENIDQMLARGG